MTIAQILSNQPPIRRIPGARRRIREKLITDKRPLVVLDDDPTGTQTVDSVPVYLGWDEELLVDALRREEPVFYLSTNSRALSSKAAARLGYQIGKNLRSAARKSNCLMAVCSRSDSTLRGHYPAEVEALSDGLGTVPDGIVLVPAFFEGGRYTIDDIHWVDLGRSLVPVHETEFARDPSFGYGHSDLKRWIEEKTKGRTRADQALSVSLSLIRQGGVGVVSELLGTARNARPIIVNAACYEDLEIFTLALLAAEASGRSYIYRTAASFVKVRGGIPDRPLLSPEELGGGEGAGLIVVGSYVRRTTRQLKRLLASALVVGVEIRVPLLLDEDQKVKEIDRVRREVEHNMSEGRSVAVYTSRSMLRQDPEEFLATGRVIVDCLCRLVGTLDAGVSFLVAKGGVTSVELARSALGLRRAMVQGQIIEGVPVWKLGSQARWQRIPYVVFPGNVGDEEALLRVVQKLGLSSESGQ